VDQLLVCHTADLQHRAIGAESGSFVRRERLSRSRRERAADDQANLQRPLSLIEGEG